MRKVSWNLYKAHFYENVNVLQEYLSIKQTLA